MQLHGPYVQEVLSAIGASTDNVKLSKTRNYDASLSPGSEGGHIAVVPLNTNTDSDVDQEEWDHVVSVSDKALFDKLDAVVFSRLKASHRHSFFQSMYYEKYVYTMIQCEKRITYDDFVLFRAMGRGGFGLVSGCKRAQSGQLYAIKQLDRRRIKKKNASSLCINERNILAKVSSPFIVCMQYAFTSPTELYLVLDLMVGGDMGYHLQHRGFFSAKETKYYIARTVLGIKALHNIGVVFRDLKPDNILMDSHGRTKLSDLGECLSKLSCSMQSVWCMSNAAWLIVGLSCEVPSKGLSGAYGTRGYW